MDSCYVAPQLSGGNFSYARLPHLSHGVFSSGPIGGTFAQPSNPPDALIEQLRSQHQAQSLLYGAAPSAVAHVPPPPGRGRSHFRGISRVRSAPEVPPAPTRIGVLMCPDFLSLSLIFSFPLDLDRFPATRTSQLLTRFWPRIELLVFRLNVLLAPLQHCWISKLLANTAQLPVKLLWTVTSMNLCRRPRYKQLTLLQCVESEVLTFWMDINHANLFYHHPPIAFGRV